MTDPRYPAVPPPSGYPPPSGGGPAGSWPQQPPGGGWPQQPPAGGGAGGQGGWPTPPVGPGGQGGWQSQPGGGGGGGRSGLLIVLGVIIVLALAGGAVVLLNGDDDESASGPPAGVTLADLEPALLTEADVGSDFSLDEFADDSDSDDNIGDEIDASDECEAAAAAMETGDEGSEELTATFTNASDGELEQTISLGGDGAPTLAEARSAVEQCDTMTYSEGGAEGEITISTSDVDGVGDDAMGMTMNLVLTTQGITVSTEMYAVMWDRDGIHGTVSGTAGLDESTMSALPIDHSRVEDLARTADQRIVDALPG